MIIKRLSASFGRLQNETLALERGLNIIQAPNECGKSTWCAFIKAMLYGIRTSDRDKTGYLSDKTRYRPWSGAPMTGSMDFVYNGDSVTLERKSDGRLPMRDFAAFYTGTGQPYPGLSPDSAGEALLGVSEAVFERSAYMSQAGIRVTATPELEKRISALVTTGDEGASYTETDERLRAWLRKRRFNKAGTIPALEDKINEYAGNLARIEAAVDDSAAMRLELERLQKKCGELALELDAFKKYEAGQAFRRAGDKLTAAREAYKAVYAELSKNGPAPDEAAVAAIRGENGALASLRTLVDNAQARLEDARANLAIIQEQRGSAAFTGEDAARAAENASKLDADIRKLSFGSLSAVITLVLTALAAAAAVYAGLARSGIPPLLPVTAAAAVLGVILLVWRAARLSGRGKSLRGLLSRYNAASIAELISLGEECALLEQAERDAGGDVRSAEKSLASAAAVYDEARRSFQKKLSDYALNPGPGDIEHTLGRIETLLKKLADARAETAAAENYMKTIKESGACLPDMENGGAIPPAGNREERASELRTASARLDDLTRRYNMALGEIRGLGDPVVIGSEKTAAEATLNEHRAQYEALSLAVETLKEASDELQSRFSPILGETAGRIIGRLTGGRYEGLTFDKALDGYAKEAGGTISQKILYLSAGTTDQVYLALRLAVCELLLTGAEPCPLVLDDTLTNFDDGRAQIALEYLKELSEKRQILLFTCHGREAACFRNGGANVVRLH